MKIITSMKNEERGMQKVACGKLCLQMLFCFFLLHSSFCLRVWGQGTAFTYQGRLNDGGAPANGNYDLRFILYDSSVGGNQQGPILTNAATAVNSGLFTVTLDFSNQFPGAARWLDIAVRTNGNGTFTALNTRQLLAPTPYAITANSASNLLGTLPAVQLPAAVVTNNSTGVNLAGTFTGNGANLTNVPAASLGGLGAAGFWKTGGNGGTTPGVNFVGTTDNVPLELWVNGSRAFRLEPNTNGAPNVIGGAAVNFVSTNNPYAATEGATIAGGGGAGPDFFVGSTVNTTNGIYAPFATVGGGGGNVVSANAPWATVPGGYFNYASGACSFAAGGNAQATGHNSFVWSDGGPPFYGPPFTSTANGQFAVRAYGGVWLEADVQIGTGTSDYRKLALGGGNSTGFLYGSYPKWGDGIHLGYNYYADASGADWIPATDGPTSRLSVGYGYVGIYIGGVNTAPNTQRLLANSSGVTVNGSFSNQSDRNAKQDFASISPAEILDKVARLPVSEWSYKEDPATRHVGPVAQDFYSLFSLGIDDKHITPLDEGGVALAAIQALNQKLEATRAEIKRRDAENAELKRRLEKLEQLINSLKGDNQ